MLITLVSLSLTLAVQASTIGPNLTAGHTALSFTAKDKNGHTVHFPNDFKGKVVMLDFWSTQCGPCMLEAPNIVRAYRSQHSEKGFEILGVSLNNKDSLKTWHAEMKAKGMTWDQITDDKYWESPIVRRYGVMQIPQAFIVDGSTGKILAEGEEIEGSHLLPAVKRALAARSKNRA